MRQENGLQRQEKIVTPKALALIAEIRLFYIVDGRLIKLQKMIKWIIEGLKYFRSQVLQRNRKNLGRAQEEKEKYDSKKLHFVGLKIMLKWEELEMGKQYLEENNIDLRDR